MVEGVADSRDSPAASADNSSQAEPGQNLPPGSGERLRDAHQVFNNLRGNHIENAWFGVSEVRTESRSFTGIISEDEISQIEQLWVAPEPVADARGTLEKHRLLLIHGAPSIGKRASAIKLLREAGRRCDIISLAPHLSIDALIEREYSSEKAYIIVDHLESRETSSYLAYQLELLSQRLIHNGSFLAITAQFRSQDLSARSSYIHSWFSPSHSDLFEKGLRYFGTHDLTEEQADQVRAASTMAAGPAEIITLARAGKDGVDQAITSLASSGRDLVNRWIEREPKPDELFATVATAFLEGADEELLETVFESLRNDYRTDYPSADSLDSPLRQSKKFIRDESAIVELDSSSADEPDYRRRTVRYRLKGAVTTFYLMEALQRYYGNELWSHVNVWIERLSAVNDPDVQVRAAYGVAALWANTPLRVETRFLTPWSQGDGATRSMSAYVLWWLAADDDAVSAALGYAERWLHRGSHEQRQCAILALSGRLGVRFGVEAIRWLWSCQEREGSSGSDLASLAREAIADLWLNFLIAGERGSVVLAYVDRQIQEASKPNANFRTLNRATTVANVMLSSTDPETGTPIPALAIRIEPACVDSLGRLWATVIRNRPTRWSGISALAATIEVVAPKFRRGDLPSIAELGKALSVNLGEKERIELRDDLAREVSEGSSSSSKSRSSILGELIRSL